MVIRVRQGKGARDRDVPMSAKLLEALREYWRWNKPKEYLFPSSPGHRGLDQPTSDKTVWNACQTAAKRAGLRKHIGPTPYGIPTPHTCWKLARISARFSFCWVILTWKTPRFISICRSNNFTPRSTRSIRSLFVATRKLAPERRASRRDTATVYTRFTLATSVGWKEKGSDNYNTRTERHRVISWDKLGVWAGTLQKGAYVEVEGEPATVNLLRRNLIAAFVWRRSTPTRSWRSTAPTNNPLPKLSLQTSAMNPAIDRSAGHSIYNRCPAFPIEDGVGTRCGQFPAQLPHFHFLPCALSDVDSSQLTGVG